METTAPKKLIADTTFERQSPTVEAMRRLLKHRSAQVGLVLLGILIICAIFAPWIAPYDPIKPIRTATRRSPPCIHWLGCPADQEQHILGVDGNSRDLFSRIIYGSRVSLSIGIKIIGMAIIVGGLLGALAGFLGGGLDNGIMRSMDVLMAFPGILLAIAIVAVLGPGLDNALIAIAIIEIPIYARVLRASVLEIKDRDFVTASRSMGAGNYQLLFTRVMPNAMTP